MRCLGLIKDLCVSLVQYPAKTILMDIVVADIPPKCGMSLSRPWGAKLQGSLQLDMSYTTILVFGQPKRLYRKTLIKYVVSSQEKPQNFPIYSVHSDMDSFIIYNVEIDPPHTIKVIADEIEKISNERSSVWIQQISENHDTSDKSEETKKPDLPIKQIPETPDTNYEHEMHWYLEFDGFVNKLGARARV